MNRARKDAENAKEEDAKEEGFTRSSQSSRRKEGLGRVHKEESVTRMNRERKDSENAKEEDAKE
jgi:hypothetical protein